MVPSLFDDVLHLWKIRQMMRQQWMAMMRMKDFETEDFLNDSSSEDCSLLDALEEDCDGWSGFLCLVSPSLLVHFVVFSGGAQKATPARGHVVLGVVPCFSFLVV